VVLDATTGELLAAASYPWPVDELQRRAAALDEDDDGAWLDRARYGVYPPGSTFKLLVAAAALRSGADRDRFVCQRLPDGRVGNYVRGASRPVRDDPMDTVPHGDVDLDRGLIVSCNAYFAQLALAVGPRAVMDAASLFQISVARSPTVDALRPTLAQVGYGQGEALVTPLKLARVSAAIASGDLSKYSTILLGIRAYAARPELKTYNQRLLDYVNRGGVLVVQYNTQEFDSNYGPYPYEMTMRAEEISEENGAVEMLDPADPVFQTPNTITSRDFDGWVEQRGSKFLASWDSRYKPLLASNDTGQSPQRGGWLVTRHGRGLYVYCAYAWYRQIPYAVPGAMRIFANLVSLGAFDASWRSAGK